MSKVTFNELLDAGAHFGTYVENGIQTWLHTFLWKKMESTL